MLTGWKVNIISKAKLQEKVKLASENLLQLSMVNDPLAQVLVQNGVMSIVDLSAMEADFISKVTGRTAEDAQNLINEAAKALEDENIKSDIEMEDEIVSASAVPNSDKGLRRERKDAMGRPAASDAGKFSDAEKRLREELAAFKLK